MDQYEVFTGELTKLRQTSTIKDYQTQFEKLADITLGLSELLFKSCFISGLKKKVKAEVKRHAPQMQAALMLTKLAGEKQNAQHHVYISPLSQSYPQTTPLRHTFFTKHNTKSRNN